MFLLCSLQGASTPEASSVYVDTRALRNDRLDKRPFPKTFLPFFPVLLTMQLVVEGREKKYPDLNENRISFLNLCTFPMGTRIVAMLGGDICQIFILFHDLLHSFGATQPYRLLHFGNFFFPKSFSSLQNLYAPTVFRGDYELAWRLF